MKGFANKKSKGPRGDMAPWRMFALFSGATLQLPTCIVVFGYFGHMFALRWHHPWLNVVGVLVGIVVGASGLAFLAHQFLGDKS